MNRLTHKTYWNLLPDFSRQKLNEAATETRVADHKQKGQTNE